jgi:hypothetical protein
VPRFSLTTPFRRALGLVAVAAVAFGVISALPSGGVVDASARGAAAQAMPVRLLAHDVSHAIRRQPKVRAHVTRRRMDISTVFTSALTRLVPKPKRTLASAFHALAPVTIGSFDGTAGPGGYNPGDPNGDIGLTQYVQAVNLRLAVYSRAAPHSTLARLTNAQFWNGLSGPDGGGLCATSPWGDPSVQYDRLADRWVYSEFAFDVDGTGNPVAPFVQCVAVSSSPDATGTWYRYAFQVSTTKFPDYPKLGVWSDGYYLSYNQFDMTTGAFAGAGALALERSKMLNGSAAQARYFDLESVNPGLGGMLPATMEGTNLPPAAPAGAADELYLQSLDDLNNTNDRLQVWAFHVDWSAPVTGSHFYPVADLPVNTFSSAFGCVDALNTPTTDCILQPQTTKMLDEVAAVVQDGSAVIPQLMYHLDYVRDLGGTQHMVATQTVNAGSNQAAVRWYELRNAAGTWSVGAQGDYVPDGDSRFMSSGGIDNSGELAIAYSVTGSTTYPSLRYTGRLPGDAPGAMSIAETSLLTGSLSQTDSNRWGDYSSLSLDPIDLCTFWYTGQYVGATTGGAWRTRIGAFNFSTCISRSPTPPLMTADPTWSTPIVRENQTITYTAGTFAGAVSRTYQWRRCDRYGLACVDIPGETALTHLFTATDAAGDRTVRLQETVTNATGTVVAASTATPVVQSLVPVNTVRPVISGTAQAGQTLTTTTGTWVSSSPMSYTYRWRLCSPTCAFIAGATSQSYVVSSADVGNTIDVIVSGTNTGGGTDANADPTGIVQAAPPTPVTPPTGGGGGGGGSGGSGGALDLAVTGYQTPASPKPGDNVTYVLSVDDLTPNQLAQSVYLNVALPTGVSLLTTYADRGSGCTALSATQLRCYLDFLSGQAPHANVLITAKVIAAGTQVLVATVTAQQSESSLTNNTLTFTYTSNSTSTPEVPVGLNGDGTPTVTQDKKKPTARALLTSAKRGAVAKLRFKIYDDHGIAKAITTVKRGTTVIGRASTGYGPVVSGSVYYVGWRVPTKAAKGKYTFCVTAVDRAGNKSARSCAPVALK